MANAYIFNSSAVEIKISINNGDFLSIPAASSTAWTPSNPTDEPTFNNNTTPAQGAFFLGANTITMYPATSGPSASANFTVDIPTSVTVNSFQLYLFWKDATNVAWAALNGGQILEVSSTQETSKAA